MFNTNSIFSFHLRFVVLHFHKIKINTVVLPKHVKFKKIVFKSIFNIHNCILKVKGKYSETAML